MVSFKDFTDSAVNRSNHFVASWFDCNTVADDFLSENNVWHIFNVDNFTRDRRYDFNSANIFFIIRN